MLAYSFEMRHEISNNIFVCSVALRPKSTAMVMAGRVPGQFTWPHFFLGKLEQAIIYQYFVHILSLVTDNNPS